MTFFGVAMSPSSNLKDFDKLNKDIQEINTSKIRLEAELEQTEKEIESLKKEIFQELKGLVPENCTLEEAEAFIISEIQKDNEEFERKVLEVADQKNKIQWIISEVKKIENN